MNQLLLACPATFERELYLEYKDGAESANSLSQNHLEV